MMKYPQRQRKHSIPSVVLANLKDHEYRKFNQAGIPFSGSTGAGATPEINGKYAPCIATSLSELPQSLVVLSWQFVEISFAGEQLIVKEHKASQSPREWNVDTYLAIAKEQLALAKQETNLPVTEKIALVLDSLTSAVEVLWNLVY